MFFLNLILFFYWLETRKFLSVLSSLQFTIAFTQYTLMVKLELAKVRLETESAANYGFLIQIVKISQQ